MAPSKKGGKKESKTGAAVRVLDDDEEDKIQVLLLLLLHTLFFFFFVDPRAIEMIFFSTMNSGQQACNHACINAGTQRQNCTLETSLTKLNLLGYRLGPPGNKYGHILEEHTHRHGSVSIYIPIRPAFS